MKISLPQESFGFDEDDFADAPPLNASNPLPNVDVIPPSNSNFLSSDGSASFEAPLGLASADSLLDAAAAAATAQGDDFPLVATQPLTQSQHNVYRPEMEQELVGCLMPSTAACPRFNLFKAHESRAWKIGRHPTNNLMLPGLKLSNFHCTLKWNGKTGKKSEVTLADNSTNGTWVNNVCVTRGQTAILRSGAAISLGGQPDAPNDYRFIFRDIEGHSTRHMNQIWARYDVGYELGAGSFARVHKCVERATGDEYAVKVIDRTKLRRSQTHEQAIVREISILQQLAEFRHKNIVSLREHFEEEDAIYLVLELVKGGDLLNYLGTHGPIDEQEVRRMAAQICHAVAYVHSEGIAHRDLKPENVMMTATNPPDCKVADFGLAKLVDDGTFLKTVCGTPAYLAPEVMLNGNMGYDNRVDSWSLGIIFYCMLTNHAPFQEQYDANMSVARQRQYFNTRQIDWSLLAGTGLSEDGMDFLRHILTEDPRNRKEVAYMLDHHWISGLVPTDSQFQHPVAMSDASTPHTVTDGALACSQSFENLNLSDITIPGLPSIRGPAGSIASEASVTAMIPGAFPKPPKKDNGKARQPPEASAESSWDVVTPSKKRGAVRRNDVPDSTMAPASSPINVPAKRKVDPIAGSSPLTSLSSSDEEEVPVKKPLARRPTPYVRKGAETSTGRRKARAGPSTTRAKRGPAPRNLDDRESSADENPPHNTRRTGRRHAPAAKAARLF